MCVHHICVCIYIYIYYYYYIVMKLNTGILAVVVSAGPDGSFYSYALLEMRIEGYYILLTIEIEIELCCKSRS